MFNISRLFILSLCAFMLFTYATLRADDGDQAAKYCKGNKPCIATYMRYLDLKAKLNSCAAEKKLLQSTIDQLKLNNGNASCPACAACDPCTNTTPASNGLPPSGDTGYIGSNDTSVCTKEILYKDKATVVVKIKAMDVDPMSATTIQALKQGCIKLNPSVTQFVQAFLCYIQAAPALASNAEIVSAIDDLEYVDLDSTNICVEINQLP